MVHLLSYWLFTIFTGLPLIWLLIYFLNWPTCFLLFTTILTGPPFSYCSLTIFTGPHPIWVSTFYLYWSTSYRIWLSTFYLYWPTSYLTVHLLSLLVHLLSDCLLSIFTGPPLIWLSTFYLYWSTSYLTVHLLSFLSHLLSDCCSPTSYLITSIHFLS